MKRIDKIIIYSIFIVPTVLLFSFALWSGIFGESAYEIASKRDLNKVFSGKVDTLYFEVQNHGIKIAKLNDGYECEIFSLWERYIDVGDSLSKKKGDFKVYIYKKDNKEIILDYRDTYKK